MTYLPRAFGVRFSSAEEPHDDPQNHRRRSRHPRRTRRPDLRGRPPRRTTAALPPRSRRHGPASLDAFVSRATTGLGESDTAQAVMEPTGMSWFPVAHRLADAGVSVARVNSQRVGGKRVEAPASRRGAATSPNTPRPISPTPMSWPPFPASVVRGSTLSTSQQPRAMHCSGSPSSAGACRTPSPTPGAGYST